MNQKLVGAGLVLAGVATVAIVANELKGKEVVENATLKISVLNELAS